MPGAVPGQSGARAGAGITVGIIDDHLVLAESVAASLTAAGGVTVVFVAATGAAGLAGVRDHLPDVCLLDQNLPDGLGTDLLPSLHAASAETKVLLLSGLDSGEVLQRAVQGGCVGFIGKGQRAAVLLDAVRRAAAGEAVFSVPDLRRLLAPVGPPPSRRVGDDLTSRERQVLSLLSLGRSTSAIAEELGLANTTVRNHIQAVLTKLNAHSKLEAVAIALHERVVMPP
jgi:DNA-binding NarL/FixJ family response regulator